MKGLKYIFGLFVVGLGIINFSNAQVCNSHSVNVNQGVDKVGTYKSFNGYNISVLSKGNLSSSSNLTDYKDMLVLHGKEFMFRNSDGLPYIYINNNLQGIPFSYGVCNDPNDMVSSWYMSDCNYYELTGTDYLRYFLSTVDDTDYYGHSSCSDCGTNYYRLCITSNELGKALCFTSQCGGLTGSIGLNNANFSNIDSSLLYPSPGIFGGGNGGGNFDSDIIYVYSGLLLTNSGMYQGLLDMGYYKDICYGDYNSGNYIDSNSGLNQFFDGGDCEDSSPYCGMTLQEVYDSDSGGNITWNYDSWFKNFYNIFKTSYINNDLSWWNGKLKAKYKLMYKIYNNDFNSNFNATDYFTFCKMSEDIVDGTFDGGIGYDSEIYPLTSNTTERITEKKQEEIDRIKNESQFYLSGSEFSGVNDMFGVFNKLYNSSLNSFKVNSSLSNITGILPIYIVFGFFLFVLLYGLRR